VIYIITAASHHSHIDLDLHEYVNSVQWKISTCVRMRDCGTNSFRLPKRLC